ASCFCSSPSVASTTCPAKLSGKPGWSLRLFRSLSGCAAEMSDSAWHRLERRHSMKTPVLGQQTALPQTPDEAVLDRVPNPHPDVLYVARFAAPEFTSLCPVTG